MMFFFFLFLGLVAWWYQCRLLEKGMMGLRQEHRTLVKIVDVLEPFTIRITLTNASKHFMPFVKVSELLPNDMLRVDTLNKRKDGYLHDHIAFTTWLAPSQQLDFDVSVACEKRGRYVLKELVVSTGDFIGMSEQSKRSQCFTEVVVPPKPIDGEQIKMVLAGMMGDVSVRRFLYEDPVLSVGYREYTGREPMRSIAWNQSAKGLGLMVKQYDHTVEPSVSVIVHVTSAERCDEHECELCFRIARTICEQLEQQQMSYDVFTNTSSVGNLKDMSYIANGLGEMHLAEVLECLGRASKVMAMPTFALVQRIRQNQNQMAGKILITPNEKSKEEFMSWIGCVDDVHAWHSFVAQEVLTWN